nr:glycerophosphodiester phosphodiesterase [Arthrobacter roseus]
MAHRGYSQAGHENSMAAFAAAVELGYGFVETDVNTTADGVLMAFHDDVLDRVTDGTGRIADYTREELRSIRIGGMEPIPTLEEILVRWPELRLNVDVKDEAAAVLLAELMHQHQACERVLVASFSDRRRLKTLRTLRRLRKERGLNSQGAVASSPGYWVMAAVVLLGRLGLARMIARMARIQCVQVPLTYKGMRVVTAGFVRRCHRAGLQVHVWTINDSSCMNELLDIGVDGILTDRADILAGVMRERGNWPQAT